MATRKNVGAKAVGNFHGAASMTIRGGGFSFGPPPNTVFFRDGEMKYPKGWTYRIEGGALVLLDSQGNQKHAFGPSHWLWVTGG